MVAFTKGARTVEPPLEFPALSNREKSGQNVTCVQCISVERWMVGSTD